VDKLLEPLFAAVVLAAVPYSIGFFYLTAYYGHFGISISELGISQQEFFIAFAAASREIISPDTLLIDTVSLAVEIFLLSALFLVLRFGLNLKLSRFGLLPFLSITFISVWLFFLIYAPSAGSEIARRNVPTLPFVLVVDGDSLDVPIKSINAIRAFQILDVDRDRLIYSDREMIYLLRQGGDRTSFTTIRLPRADYTISMTFDYWRKP
jgi:hypothetical protein